jgi:hypothetical protein
MPPPDPNIGNPKRPGSADVPVGNFFISQAPAVMPHV